MPELIGLLIAIAFQASIVGGIVGALWSLALSVSVLSGLIWGASVSAVVWTTWGFLGAVGSQLQKGEVVFVVSSFMAIFSMFASIIALIVWGIRALI